MSRYIVEIVGPSGHSTFLSHGREVRRENAMRYSHPSAARRAALSYKQRYPEQFVRPGVFWSVVDTRTGMRTAT
jgi:hypothetical protein